MAKGNPIPFNPDQMPISQAKDCADTLSLLFQMLDRGSDASEIVGNLEFARVEQLRKYGVPA